MLSVILTIFFLSSLLWLADILTVKIGIKGDENQIV